MNTYGYGRERVIDMDNKAIAKLALLAGGLVLLALLLFASIAYVPTGHVGVLTLFGKVTGESLPEGVHLVNPLKVNNKMSIRTQELKEAASVPSSEGLIITLDTSLLFHLNPEKAPEVFQRIGPNYINVVVEPNLRSAIRSVTAAHRADALYSAEREKVAQQIYTELQRELGPRGVAIENVLLREVQLPATLKQSIEEKQRAEQESLAMAFRLDRERQEADRKRIEAEGIRDFQRTVSQGINEQLLTWKGIETTEKLATSPNTKIVVVGGGTGRGGLPIILGGN
jgi:prohibitin 1